MATLDEATAPTVDLLRLAEGAVDLAGYPTDATPGFVGDKADGKKALGALADEIERRYDAINEFEAELVDAGVAVVKCFLPVSADEQHERLVARLDDPTKHWRYNPGDLDERALWPAYQEAYRVALERTHPPVRRGTSSRPSDAACSPRTRSGERADHHHRADAGAGDPLRDAAA